MSWKSYRNLFKENPMQETHFVLGIDLGEDSSVIAYYDVNRRGPEIIDLSGGYGKPSVPTAMQYIPETKEWIFGEYAVLNAGSGESFRGLLSRLDKGEYVYAGGKPVSAVNVLGMYIKELVANCKNINPKSEIAGIVLAVPSYLSEEAKNSMGLAVKAAGYEKALIGLFSDRECIFNHFYSAAGGGAVRAGFSPPAPRGGSPKGEPRNEKQRVLLFDFAGREFRGGIYEVTPEGGDRLSIVSISSLFDRELGTMRINAAVNEMFTKFYREQTGASSLSDAVKEQLYAFTHQHKDLLFVKNEKDAAKPRPVKLYFNFAYPPFQRAVTAAETAAFIEPFEAKMTEFFVNVFKRTLMPESVVSKNDIDTVLCTGGGFEMYWARRRVVDYFTGSNVVFYKNTKGAVAEGACLAAAGQLGVDRDITIKMSDFHKLKSDIGVMAAAGQDKKGEKFVAMADVNSFWWQNRERGAFIISEAAGKEPHTITIVKRNNDGRFVPLGEVTLDGLPERPEGTTRIGVTFSFPSYDVLAVEVNDLGFGELFPKTDYSRRFEFAYG